MAPSDSTPSDDAPDEYPPNMMPSSDVTFDYIAHDDWLGIYTVGRQHREIVKSDTVMAIEQ